MKGNTETAIYVVDKEHRILQFNKALKGDFPGIREGDICYNVLCGEKAPCAECPLKKKGNSLFFNKKLRQWMEINTGALEWPGNGLVNIVFSKAVQGEHENLFYSLTNMLTYDDLLEMNLTQGTYKFLYHKEGKYLIPEREGDLTYMLDYVAKNVIHPEDEAAFLEFWNLEEIMQRMLRQSEGRVLSGQFREALVSGGYGWISQRAVPLLRGEHDDKIIMCFIQDIQEEKQQELYPEEGNKGGLYIGGGLYRRSVFWQKAEEFLRETDGRNYCLMAIDIEHFKLFNEWYGHESGDEFLENISQHLNKAQRDHGGLAGYMGDDDFCIILPNDKAVLRELQDQIMGYVKRYASNAGFLPAFGLYAIEDTQLSVSTMYDRAMMALASVKGNYAQRVSWYDADMMRKMEEDHKLLAEVQRALENKEFTFYGQPKCDMITGKIVGLESLVRWNHPKRGVISPGEFIPLLERNGFITNLDMYIWEQVCVRLKNWIDRGHTPVPISVNVSRIDLYTLDVAACFIRLAEKYSIEPRLIEVEITESAYAEEYNAISDVVGRLQKAGFTVLMDDFGSGYSSLNMLKDVNVDILKLDMKFLQTNGDNDEKGMEILEAIIKMAQLMGLRIIAEGVENREQVDILLEMGCAYGQGYYFYRPMPIDVFEPLLADESNLCSSGIEFKSETSLSIGKRRFETSQRALQTVAHIADNDKAFMRLTEENRRTAESIFAQMTPGGMIGGYCEDDFPLYFANGEMLKLLGYDTYEEFEQAIEGKVSNTIHPDDMEQVIKDIGPEYYDGLEYTTTYRMPRKDGSWFWTLDKGKVIRAEDGRLAIVSACTDLSDAMEMQEQLRTRNAELIKQNEELHFLNNDMPGGYHRCLPTPGYEFAYISNRFLDIFGYTREEIKTLFDNKFLNMVHPDDRAKVCGDSDELIETKESYNLEYRMLSKQGYIWVIDQSKYLEIGDIKCVQGVVLDVTETVELRNQMKLIRDYAPESIYLVHLTEDNTDIRMLVGGLHRNRGYQEYDGERAHTEFRENVNAKDYEQLQTGMREAIQNRTDYHGLVREYLADGQIMWVNLDAKYISSGPEGMTYLWLMGDVTDIKEKEHEISRSGEKLESILRQAAINCWDWDIVRDQIIFSNVVKNKILAKLYPVMGQDEAIVEDLPAVIERSPYMPDKYKKRFQEYAAYVRQGKNHDIHQCELLFIDETGEEVWLRMDCETICDEDGNAVRAVGYYMDITEQKQEYLKSRESIKVLQKDALTGVYTRQAAIPMIKQYLADCTNQEAAMIMFDMDNFKIANDVFGHAYGDDVIAETAERLRGFFREKDIVCRIGGDEFLVLCKDIGHDDIEKKLATVVQALSIRCQEGDREIVFTVSAGYAVIPEQGMEFDELYRKADVALFTAKTEGKSTYRKYSSDMKEIRYELADRK